MRQLPPTAVSELAHQAHADGGPPLLLLDVREPWELATAAIRIEGAVHLDIPMGELPARLDELDPLQPTLCICHHGMRSAQVVAFLERHGHGALYNLAGGIDAWSAEVDPEVPRY